MKKQDFEFHEYFCIKMSSQFTSISCRDNKSLTIFACPFKDATINGVLLKVEIKLQK